MDEIELTGFVPGAIGRVTELHGTYYAAYWDLPLYFEAKVGKELSEFMSRFNPACDFIRLARVNGQIIGAIFIDGKDAEGEGARLRWFILDPKYHGQGVGNRLIKEAVEFCKKAGFKQVYLTTFSGLNAARHLYEKFGFRLYSEVEDSGIGGKPLMEQKFRLILPRDEAE